MSQRGDGLLVVVNPHAGTGRGLKLWQAVLRARPDLNHARVICAEDPARAQTDLYAELERQRPPRILVLGGDGTVQMVLNAVLRQPDHSDIAVAIAPGGTGSDFARLLKLPPDPVAATVYLLDAPVGAVDVIEIESEAEQRFALNVVSVGISSLVAPMVNANLRHGKLTYLWNTVRALGRFRPSTLEITTEATSARRTPTFLLAIANGRSFGNGLRIAPHSAPDDGQLEVVLVQPFAHWQLPFRLLQLLTGRHLKARPVTTWPATSVQLRAEVETILEADGETLPFREVSITVRAAALRLAGWPPPGG